MIQSVKSHVARHLFTDTTLFAFTFTTEELISVIIRELRKAAEEQFGDIAGSVVTEVLQKGRAPVTDIAAIGITNQRETNVVWERQTGEPFSSAIV